MARPRIDPGSILDGFVIGPMIHAGGMALLHSVTREDLPGPAVMKLPRLFEGDDPAAIVAFEMEQMILPRLSGPHVPAVYATGTMASTPYLVMERLPAPSLYARLPDLPLPVEAIAPLGLEIATALDSLHCQEVVHLDLKPSNIMRRSGGERVLIDFGLSRHLRLPDLMQEEFRLPYGSAPYISPDQLLGRRDDPRADIFAIGVLLYFFATGVRPFGEPQRLSGLKRRLYRDPVPPRGRRAEIPKPLQEVILRCLAVDPGERYPTAAQLAFDLKDLTRVQLTERAERIYRDSWLTVWRRRMEPLPKALLVPPPERALQPPILLVSLDLKTLDPDLASEMRSTVGRILSHSPLVRLACLHVQQIGRLTPVPALDADGHNRHVAALAALERWAAPLKLPPGRVTCHVLEAVDVAEAILSYADANRVDHIVMGARPQSLRRRLLGSVSAQVAEQAPCSVTVVRRRGAPAG